jgi:hypothetical protein
VAFLNLPFITINPAMHILTKDKNTFASFEVKTWIKVHRFSKACGFDGWMLREGGCLP